MAKLRVYELAKELTMESREVIRRLGKMGCEVKNHMSTVEDKYANQLREMVKPGPGKAVVTDIKLTDKRPVSDRKGPEQSFRDFRRTDQSQRQDIRPQRHETLRSDNDRYQKVSGPRSEENRPRPQQGSRPEGQRPGYQGQKTDYIRQRPQQGPRSEGQRPGYQGQRNDDNRPRTQQGPRPGYQGQRTDDNRPRSQQGPRPGYQGQRTDDNRPRTQQGPRPGYQGQRNAADKRPKTQQGPRTQDNRPPKQPVNPQGKRTDDFRQQRQMQPKYDDKGPSRDSQTNLKIPKPVFTEKPTEKTPTGAVKKPYKNDTSSKPSKKVKEFVSGDTEVRTRGGKLDDYQLREKEAFRGKGGFRGKGNKNRKKGAVQKAEMPPAVPKKVVIGDSVMLQELAKSMGKTAAEVIKKLMIMGIMATINQELDSDTAILVAEEFGVPVEVRADKTIEIMEDLEDKDVNLVERPPVVTVMGHVDHGKTSLLDAIRKANVIATEAGGITQHIGAYQVEVNSKKITFLDTPGHEAFTAMRARGAQVTDIAILVVAADDGVMPQTVEAINHAKAANVSVIVAINKIDKPGANPDRVKQELTEHGIVPEEWGGDTVMVPVSAKTQEGIPQLLEMILLVAEMGEITANPDRMARGTVVEAELDKLRGPVATVLVQKGTLHIGDNVVAGSTFGKVRAMIDDKGRRIKSAPPSTPVELMGFSEVPPAGEIFVAVADEKDARYVSGKFSVKKREEELNKSARVSLDDLFKHISEGNVKELNIIIKADVQGSIEALRQSLNKLSTDEVRVNIIHGGVGTITESDVMLASASNAIIIGFNVRPDANTRRAAELEKIDLRLYRVIYDAIDDIKAAMTGLLDPTYKENVIGRVEVRATFKVPKVGTIAGGYVTEGKITRQAEVRVIRDGIVIHEGKIESLKRFKDDVKEVVAGYECGLGIENFNDIKDGDVIEGFIMEETKREL